jgi:hypothetical protein
MDHDTVSERHLTRFVRLVLYAAVLVGLLVGGLLLFEGGGGSPARPFGGQNISSNRATRPADGTTSTTENPNGGCKPSQPPFPHDCRPPSGT